MKQQTKGGALHKVWQALPWLWTARRGDALLNYSTIMLLPVISAGTGRPI